MDQTEGTLLGGRVLYAQPAKGHRTGIEPVLLAASVPARPGQRVLEAGTGAGAGLLCLAARVPGIQGIGIEIDADTAVIGRQNAIRNGYNLDIRTADVSATTELVDHAFANPPWHDPAGTPSPDKARTLARHRLPAGLRAWIAPLSATLAPRGTLTLILPASMLPEAMSALGDERLGCITLFPFWPKPGASAKLALVQARHRSGPARLLPGLVLHEVSGGYTAAASSILRDGAAITL